MAKRSKRAMTMAASQKRAAKAIQLIQKDVLKGKQGNQDALKELVKFQLHTNAGRVF